MIKLTVIVICAGLIITAADTAMAGGADTYKSVCSGCHESGAVGAPELKDKEEWQHRITRGMDTLYASVQNGKCEALKSLRRDLTDEVIKSAVDYMVSQTR